MPSGVKKKRLAKGTKTKARRPGGGHVFRQQGAVRARRPKAQLRHVKWKDVERVGVLEGRTNSSKRCPHARHSYS